jgi:geranylgeranyl diphosphate synthase, type II
MSFDLSEYSRVRRQMVEEALDKYVPAATTFPQTLHASIRYSLFCGGKRLRPLLTIAGSEAIGGNAESVLPLACAVECIHTFSLIHDDLPSIDNDDLRRGHPTNHKVYGEALAILAGDALLALSFELIGRCRASASSDAVLTVLEMIAKATGTDGMVGGQVVDIESERKNDIDLEAVRWIHGRKTGSLLTASLVGGAILSGATPEQETSLTIYGENMGLAFQITDDLLDIYGVAEKIGKPVGSDLKHDKATYPKVLGVEESKRMASEAHDKAVLALASFGPKSEPLKALASYIIGREY